jgi:predicted regulator of Ras-like GTPase activity (Roadblock/LC7/MglB family)
MAISSTNIIVVSIDTSYNIPGDWSAEQIVSTYSAQIPGLANMTAETVITEDVKTITFKPRTGTKGAVASTNIVVVSTDTSYNIPGDWSAEQISSTYAAQIPGLSNMTAETTIVGDVKTVTFKPRTGTKG